MMRLALLAKRWSVRALGRPRFYAQVSIEEPLPKPFVPLVAPAPVRGELDFLGSRHPIRPPVDWRPTCWPTNSLGRVTLHYLEWTTHLDDEAFAAVVTDWIRQNPPGLGPYWLGGWNSYAAAIRVVVLLQGLAVRDLEATAVCRLLDSVAEHLDFLAHNLELDLGGNHLIRDLRALLWGAAAVSPSPWRARAEELLRRELRQVLEDGLHEERSCAYHFQVLGDLLDCAWVLEPGGLRDEVLDACVRMLKAGESVTHPDGLHSGFGDSGLHMAVSAAACRQALTSLGRTPARPPMGALALETSGYFGARSAEGLLLCRCGPIGANHLPAHGHADVLALEWSVGGIRMVVDAGVFEYQGPSRAWSRSTSAHNTVALDGADQAELWGAFRVGRRPTAQTMLWLADGPRFTFVGRHDGYARLTGRPIHEREVRGTVQDAVVVDRVIGGAGQLAEARLLLHPEVSVRHVEGGVRLERGSVVCDLDTTMPIREVSAWYCPDIGVRLPTSQLVMTLGHAPCEGRFRLRRVEPSHLGERPRNIGADHTKRLP